ncbi:hypothetical protein B6N60_05157 [Richelia sinica FACHB-800]|uniref:Uncharacterized protein n=1 Tax=Richelia sinica FACHB-800 TaxID=1357546 RepID=A0A975TCV4_9NOST|nr:hypothetical protein B6N60_05157 [Richelia sinica FACHB-800]
MRGKLGFEAVSGGKVAPDHLAKIVTTIASTITPVMRAIPASTPPEILQKKPIVSTTANVNNRQILALAIAWD